MTRVDIASPGQLPRTRSDLAPPAGEPLLGIAPPMGLPWESTDMRWTHLVWSLLLVAGCATASLEEGEVTPVSAMSIGACGLECGSTPSSCAVWVDDRSASPVDACEATLPEVARDESLVVAQFGVRDDEDVEICRAVHHASGLELEFRVVRLESQRDTGASERPFMPDGWALVIPGVVSGPVVVQERSVTCEEAASRPDPEELR